MASAAGLILTADVIRTVDRGRPTAQALAIAEGRILAVHSVEEVLEVATTSTRCRSIRP